MWGHAVPAAPVTPTATVLRVNKASLVYPPVLALLAFRGDTSNSFPLDQKGLSTSIFSFSCILSTL
jgi:hypothetical protein